MFESYSFWDTLGRDRPVVIYGTGNGADKIIDVLNDRGVWISGIFASDGFVRDRTFRGFKVSSYEETAARLGSDLTVLLAFGTDRPEVLEFIKKLDVLHDLIIPDVPLYGGELFDLDFFKRNREQISENANLFYDEESRDLYCDAVNFRLTGKLKYLMRCEPFGDSVSALVSSADVIVDGGAYKGDTVEGFIRSFPGVSRIYAVEPDPGSFLKIENSFRYDNRVIPVNSALADRDYTGIFLSSSSRGAGNNSLSKRAKRVPVRYSTIDKIVGDGLVDLIKLDVEGDEMPALIGAKETINKRSPVLIVSLYHRTDDLFSIPGYIRGLYPRYKLYLRRPFSVPMWDLNLFAVNDKGGIK